MGRHQALPPLTTRNQGLSQAGEDSPHSGRKGDHFNTLNGGRKNSNALLSPTKSGQIDPMDA
jgi:hypothetical protein